MHRNQSNGSKLVLYKLFISLSYDYKIIYVSNKIKYFSYKGGIGMVNVGIIYIVKCLKELAWATGK